MGRILIRGEAGHDIIPELYPLDSEIVIDKPGKGAFYATELGDVLQRYGIENLLVCGVTTEVCVNTTVREANDRGYRCVVLADWLRLLLSRIPRDGPEDDQGPGRHLRLGLRLGRGAAGTFTGDSKNGSSGDITMSTSTTGTCRHIHFQAGIVDAGRLERLLRLRHQHPRQHAGADRAVALRAEDAGRTRVRPHPAGARPDDVPLAPSTTPGSPTGWRRRPAAATSARCRRASACRTCSSSPS